MPSVEATLYFAHWCYHCKVFEQLWDEFSTILEKTNNKLWKIDVVTKKYEEGSLKGEKAQINGKEIRGYPTVKISVKDDSNTTVEYEYTGKRTSAALADHIKNHALNNIKKESQEAQ